MVYTDFQKQSTNLLMVVENWLYTAYLAYSICFGLLGLMALLDTAYQWPDDVFGAWACIYFNPSNWLIVSTLFFLVFISRRRFLLSISPAAFLIFSLLFYVLAPLSMSSETNLVLKQQVEPPDILICIFGLMYAAINAFLLRRQVATGTCQ